MSRRCIISLFLLLWVTALNVFTLAATSITGSDLEEALNRLDQRINNRADFINRRHYRIDSIKNLLTRYPVGHEARITILEQIGDTYNAFDNDSTLHFYSLGLQESLQAGLDSMTDIFHLKRATFLPLSGRVSEAISELSMVDTVSMSNAKRISYLENVRQAFSYISAYYFGKPDQEDYWSSRALDAQRELLNLLDSKSDRYLLNRGEYLYQTRHFEDARHTLETLINRLQELNNQYARASHMLADIAMAQGDQTQRAYYLAISAAADIAAATLEVVSLQELGVYLYEQGDLERSYTYLSTALENAVRCKATTRMLSISASLPIIGQAHTMQSESARRDLTTALIITAILLLGLAILLVYLKSQVNRKQILQERLEGANQIKEVYLNQFMNLSTIYMDKLISFSKNVERKIVAGKVDDLYKTIKSGKFIEEQSSEFYTMFDKSFLKIYPSFVQSVNELLQPEARITLPEGNTLNTDLRILAFMRLGLDDASRMAQLMNYSVNTIYAYRNRLRNKAINRATFEEDVMKIKSI